MLKTNRKNRSAEEGRTLVAEYLASGKTQGAFCAERGIGVSVLQYWLRRMKEEEEQAGESGGRTALQLVEVQVGIAGKPSVAQEIGVAELADYEAVVANGKRLRIRRGFDAGEVAVLVNILEGR